MSELNSDPTTHAEDWWNGLTPGTRARIKQDPWGPVPPEIWREVMDAGGSVIGAYWPSTESGPDGFRLPSELARFAENA